MWNTFAAGLQMVQEKLDNVLDDSQLGSEQVKSYCLAIADRYPTKPPL